MTRERISQIRTAVERNPAGAEYYVRELISAVEALDSARLRAEKELAEALAQLDVARKVSP